LRLAKLEFVSDPSNAEQSGMGLQWGLLRGMKEAVGKGRIPSLSRENIFACLGGAAVVGVGWRREGAKERAVVRSAAATVAALSSAIAAACIRHPPPSASSQVNGYKPACDAMRMQSRYHDSRGGQCTSRELLGSFGRQLLTDWWEAGYIARMCPFGPHSRHMQQISGQYWKLVISTPNNCPVLMSGTGGVRGSMSMPTLCVLTPSLSLHCSAKRRRVGARKEG
jgi:hypothetical protein